MVTDPRARLYASAIAIVSGVYSMASPMAVAMRGPMGDLAAGFGASGWIMLALGIVVLVHGIVLLTPAASALGRASGPLMILWATIMLVNQALLATMPGMGPGMREMMTSPMTGPMGWDAGMVAVAVLMLVSGLIMTSQPPSAPVADM
jgi:hypothetical protein